MAHSMSIALVLCLSVFVYANVDFDFHKAPDACRKTPPVVNNYVPKGHYFELDNMTVYETDGGNASKVLILVYDIFGFHNNTNEVADRMAQEWGFKVAIPNLFRVENPFHPGNWPPEDPTMVPEFLARYGNWNLTTERDLRTVSNYYYGRGANAMGLFGFCWGGKVGTLVATYLSQLFNGTAIIHPSGVENSEAIAVQIPMYLMPTMNEPNMLPFYMTLQSKPFGGQCRHRRFDDMFHGFSGARGNFSNPLNKVRVDEVISNMGGFFTRVMNPAY